jgi:protein SCO1/2
MPRRATLALLLLPWLAGCPDRASTTRSGPLPPTSLHHLTEPWTDAEGTTRRLADLRGHVVVMTMMFTNCEYACPRIVADLKAIEAALPAAALGETRFVLASFDAARDLPGVLREYARAAELPAPRWTLLHAPAGTVRTLAAALGITYQPVTGGGFAHSNVIVVLDRDGVIVHRQEGLGADPAPTVAAVTSTAR